MNTNLNYLNWKILILFLIIFLAPVSPTIGQSSWKSPDYKPEVYRNVLVHAKIADELVRRQVEDALEDLL